jgi:hypothetical protein
MIIKGNKVNGLVDFAKEEIAKKGYYPSDECYQMLFYIKRHPNKLQNIHVIVINGRITGFVFKETKFNTLMLTPSFVMTTTLKEKTLAFKDIKNYFKQPHVILMDKYFSNSNDEKFGLTPCSTTIEADGEDYELNLNEREKDFFVSKEDWKNLLIDNFKAICLPAPDLDKLTFDFVKGDEVASNFNLNNDVHYPFMEWISDSYQPLIFGFHYTTMDFASNQAALLAKIDGKVIGIIKIGKYYEGKYYEHIGLNYVDVNFFFRNKGLLTRMVDELTKYINGSIPFVLSFESEMGKICRVHNHFKKAPFKGKVFTDKEWEIYLLSLNQH